MSMAVDTTGDTAVLLKLLGEPARWEIVRRLAIEDLCTCHLVDELGVAQPLVSHHLKVLRQAGVVRTEPCGAFTYYVLDRGLLAGLADVMAELGSHGDGRRPRRPCA